MPDSSDDRATETTRLVDLLREAALRFAAMSPQEQAEHRRKQIRGAVCAEAYMGSDADETEFAAAHAAGDHKTMARLSDEARARRAIAEAECERMGL